MIKMTEETLCKQHSGMVEREKNMISTLEEIKADIKEILKITKSNEKRIDKIYIISGTVWFMLSGAMGLFFLAVKYKLI